MEICPQEFDKKQRKQSCSTCLKQPTDLLHKIKIFRVSKIHHQLTYYTPFHLVYMYVPHFQGIVSMQKESLLDRYLPNPHGIAAHEHHNHRPRTYTLGGFCYYCANAALLFSFSWRCILIHTKNTTPMEKKESAQYYSKRVLI